MKADEPLHLLVGTSGLISFTTANAVAIDADPTAIATWGQQAHRIHSGVLTENDGDSLDWYHYNDERFNGIFTIETWAKRHPNLRLIEKTTVTGMSLASLLESVETNNSSGAEINITFSQGDPLSALKGIQASLSRVQTITLTGPQAEQMYSNVLTSWLSQQGFRRLEGQPYTWDLDLELRAVIAERDELRSQVTELEEKLAQINHELDDILGLIDQAYPQS